MRDANLLFGREKYAATNGITIPYRIWFPEDYWNGEKCPLLLYMHGNGSRGSDNERQLTTVGGALLRKIFGEERRCAILAPQCIAESQWVNTYAGDANYALGCERNPYYVAAYELFEQIASEGGIDSTRIYVCGSSNGAGATWDLILRHPDVFAAAVPIAGTGKIPEAKTDGLGDLIAKTPVWTFHGDADALLSVEGTRRLVAEAERAGADIRYTEVKGATHGNIWQIAADTEGLTDWIFAQRKQK